MIAIGQFAHLQKGIQWSKDPRLDLAILEWLEGHEEERLVLLGVKRSPLIFRRDCSEMIANAIVQAGILQQDGSKHNRLVDGSRVIRRLRRRVLDFFRCRLKLTATISPV